MAIADTFKIPVTNRPFFDWPVLVRLDRDDDGYLAVYRTQRVYIHGMPELRSMSAVDGKLYLAWLLAKQDQIPDLEDDDRDIEGELIRLRRLQQGGT